MSKNSHAKHEHKNKTKHQAESYEKPHEDYHAGKMGDLLIGLLILGLGLFFIIPFYALIPASGQMFVIGFFFLVIILFAIFLWRKRRK